MQAGSFTVGSGGDYANWALATAAITSPLTGNLTFTQISDCTTTATANVTSLSLAGFTLKFTSNKPHRGNSSGGWLTSIGHGGSGWIIPIITTAGTVEFEDLNIKRTVKASGIVMLIQLTTSVANTTYLIHDSIFNDNATALANTTGSCIARSGVGQNWFGWDCWNLLLYDFAEAGISYGGAQATQHHIENVTAISSISGAAGLVSGSDFTNTWRSCFASATTCYSPGTSTTLENCSSTDATGTAGMQNLILANEIISTTYGIKYFLRPTGFSKIGGNGSSTRSISGNVLDIEGKPRPAMLSEYACGAFESAVPYRAMSCVY